MDPHVLNTSFFMLNINVEMLSENYQKLTNLIILLYSFLEFLHFSILVCPSIHESTLLHNFPSDLPLHDETAC